MRRLLTALVTVIFPLLMTYGSVAAEKPTPPNLYWSVEWGRQGDGDWRYTRWFAQANPEMQLMSYVSFSNWGGSSVLRNIPIAGVQAIFAANNHIYAASGFQIALPGEDHSIAGTNWNKYNCFPGPQVEFLLAERRLVVHNTTTSSLWIFNPREPEEAKELKPGEVFSHRMFGWNNGLNLQTTPSMEPWNECASVFWWLDKEQNP